MPPPFLPGLALCRILYTEHVRPILAAEFPGLTHSAARVGPGSEVLGLDTERSTDHDWGPRLDLFLTPDDAARHGPAIVETLSHRLPKRVRGWSTHFAPAPDEPHTGLLADTDGPVRHRVTITDPGSWLRDHLGVDPRAGMATRDWLSLPAQRLAEVTAGAVYHDGLGELVPLRRSLEFYPDDVWRYVLACQWGRIAEEEPFVGRCAEAGDDLGSRVVAARLARDVMRLALLLARRYPPYGKWLGSAFARLPESAELRPHLEAALATADGRHRQEALAAAYRAAAEWQNRTGLAEPLDPSPRGFHNRPYPVIGADRFCAALLAGITDPELAGQPPVGAVDQYADSTGVLTRVDLFRPIDAAMRG